jgi:hypothetical protein
MATKGSSVAAVPDSTEGLQAELEKQIQDTNSDIRAFLTADVL